MQQFVPTTTTLEYSNFSRCCNVFTPSYWEGSSNLNTPQKSFIIDEIENQIETCDKIEVPGQSFINNFNLAESNIKREPCQVAEVSASDNSSVEQHFNSTNLINDSNTSMYCTFNKVEGCQNNSMDNENTLQSNNEFTGIPIGFGFTRQKMPDHLNDLNTPKDTNHITVGIGLRNIENRNAPFSVNQEILINGTNSVLALNNENHNNTAMGMNNIRTSNPFWQYPIAVHESLLAMPFPSLGLQLMRDHNSGHLLFLPPSTTTIDTLHPTIVWPPFQQPSQTTQMPHIVFPSLSQALPTPFTPLHMTGSDFLTSTTLHQHTQTQTRLVAVSTPDNKRKVVIGPKLQQHSNIKIEDKNEMKIEGKNTEFASNSDSKMCFGEKISKSTFHFDQELKESVISRVQQNKSTQLNSFWCEAIDSSSLTTPNSHENLNEISTTEISSSSECVTSLNDNIFCCKGVEDVECFSCPFVLERQDAHIQTKQDSRQSNKDEDVIEDIENETSIRNIDVRNEIRHKFCNTENDCENINGKRTSLEPVSHTLIQTADKLKIDHKNSNKINFSENVTLQTTSTKSENAIDLSGLELLSNISIEAIESKVLHIKKEIGRNEQTENDSNQMNNEIEGSIQGSSENMESQQSTLGGLNLLCALAEQRIQEEGNNTNRKTLRICKKDIRQKKRKIIRCNKIREKKTKYLKGQNQTMNNVNEEIRHVFKNVKSKYNYCDECTNKKFSEVSDCFHRDVKWPTAAEIFRAMELKMRRKLAAISQKCEEKKKELQKITTSNIKENNSYLNKSPLNSSIRVSSPKIKSRSPSPPNIQNNMKFKPLSSRLCNEEKYQQTHNVIKTEISKFKSSLQPKLSDTNNSKKSYNAEEISKSISTSINILPSVLGNNLSTHSSNTHQLNNSRLIVDKNNSNFNEEIGSTKSIVLRLQKPNFSDQMFSEADKNKADKVFLQDKRLRKLLKDHSSSKKSQKHKLMKHKYIHMEEKKKIIDGHLRISDNHLKESKIRVLTAMGGLFYAGYLQPIEPPDVYAVTLDGERGNKPHIMCREEILRDVILEISPASINEVPQGTRICAYWSPQYRCLYPGTTVEINEETRDGVFVSVEFDDGDSGKISLEDIRFLLSDYPIAEYNSNPLTSLGKKKSRKIEDSLGRNENIPQLKTDNMVIERCKHHKIRRDACIGFHYEHCKKHKQKCADETCWPKKQKKKKKHKKHHRKRSTSLNKIKHGENNVSYNEILTNDEPESVSREINHDAINATNTVVKEQNNVKIEKKWDKSNSKIAAFLPEKQLWQWLGDYFRRVGVRGRTKKKFYKSIQRGDETLTIGDCAVFLSTDTDRPYIGKIQTMWETSSNNKVVRVRWFYHPEETVGCAKLKYSDGLFESSHEDENDVQTISHKCEVLSLDDYIEKFGVDPTKCSVYNNNDTYYYAGFYEPVTHKIKMQSSIPTSEDQNENENFST